MKQFFVASLVAASLSSAFANGEAYHRSIVAVDVRQDGNFLITLNEPPINQPVCVTDTTRMIGNTGTMPNGLAMLQLALFAFEHGSVTYIDGTGTCTTIGIQSFESLVRIEVQYKY